IAARRRHRRSVGLRTASTARLRSRTPSVAASAATVMPAHATSSTPPAPRPRTEAAGSGSSGRGGGGGGGGRGGALDGASAPGLAGLVAGSAVRLASEARLPAARRRLRTPGRAVGGL